MIKINNKKYNNYDISITWGKFTVSSHGKRRTGISPLISFNIENKIVISLELIFSDKMFKEMKENVKTNIKEYISDVLYEDERGLISIINSEYDCDITRIDKESFKIDFYIKAEENISIDSNVTLL